MNAPMRRLLSRDPVEEAEGVNASAAAGAVEVAADAWVADPAEAAAEVVVVGAAVVGVERPGCG